jgi:hypothetical protein
VIAANAGRIAAAIFTAGTLLLFISESSVLRVPAVLAIFVSLALGVYAIASPEFLAAEPDETARPTGTDD